MRTIPFAILALSTMLLRVAPAIAETIVVTEPPNDCGDPEDKFGRALASAGSNLLVGAPGEVCGYAYLVHGKTGEMLLTLQSPLDEEANAFGGAVAAGGRNLVVAAANEDAVYVFDRKTGALRQTLPSPTCCFTGFGASVAALGGNRVAVGAPTDGDGTVYVFDVESGDVTATIPNPTPGTGRLFGTSLAVAGRSLLVGAPIDPFPPTSSAGAAFVVNPNDGSLLVTLTAPTPNPSDQFGRAVAARPGQLLVGARGTASAYLFDASGAFIRTFDDPASQPGSGFGGAVALRGRRAVVGAPLSDGGDVEGAAYLFRASTGALLDSVEGNDFLDALGTSVALLRKGFAAGAPTQGSGYVLIVR